MYAESDGPGLWFGSVALRYKPAVVDRVLLVRGTGDWRPSPPIWDDRPIQGCELQSDGRPVRPAALARLEAVLLLGREPLASRRLAALAGLADGTLARTLVRTLNRLYDTEGRAFRVVEAAGGFLLMTRAKSGTSTHCIPPGMR